MAPKPLLPGAAVLLLRLLFLLPLQADLLHGGATAVRTIPHADLQADPHRTPMSLRLLDAFTRRPRQIRFKSSYLELPAVLRELVGIRGLGHLSYFVQVDVPVTPPASTALERLPTGTKTYFPPYVSLLRTATTDETTTKEQQNSVVSKTLGSSHAIGKQTGFGGLAVIPIKNLSQVSDNKLDTPHSTSTVSTSLGTDGEPSTTPSYFTYSTSNSTISAAKLQNVSYPTSEISWLPQSFNFLRSSPLGVSSSPPRTVKVTSTATTITIPSLTTTTTTTPPTTIPTTTSTSSSSSSSSEPSLSLSSSSSYQSSYFFSVFSTTTPLPLTLQASSSPPAADSTHLSNSASNEASLLKAHTTTPRPYPLPTPPPSLSTTSTPSSLSSSHLPARSPPPVTYNSTASSFPLIKKHSSVLKSFTLPSTSSPSSKSFAFTSPPSYSSLKSRAPSSKSSPFPVQSVTPSSTTVPSKHVVKYAKFTPTPAAVKSVKVLTPSSISQTKSSSLRPSRPLRTTSFPRVIQSNSPSKAALGTDPGSHSTRRPSACLPDPLVPFTSTTARPSPTQRSCRPTILPKRPSKSPSRSTRLLSSTNNFFPKTSRPSTSQSSSFTSRLSAQMRTLPSLSLLSSKHKAASSSSSTSTPTARPTTPGTNTKTFSSTSVQVLQFPRGWKRGRVISIGGNVKSKDKAEGRLRGGGQGEGRGGGGEGKDGDKGGGASGGGGESTREVKAGKKTLGDIILDRKRLLGRIKGGDKGSGSTGRLSRLGKLQIRSKPGKGNRIVADRKDFALPALRMTPKPEGRTRPPDRRINDDATVPERGSADYSTLSSIPRTAFVCPDAPEGGYFADQETGCRVFHVCWENRRATFLCPVGTLFNQGVQVCDWWYNVECEAVPEGVPNTSAKDT